MGRRSFLLYFSYLAAANEDKARYQESHKRSGSDGHAVPGEVGSTRKRNVGNNEEHGKVQKQGGFKLMDGRGTMQADDVYFVTNMCDFLPCEVCGEKLSSVHEIFGQMVCEPCVLNIFILTRRKE